MHILLQENNLFIVFGYDGYGLSYNKTNVSNISVNLFFERFLDFLVT